MGTSAQKRSPVKELEAARLERLGDLVVVADHVKLDFIFSFADFKDESQKLEYDVQRIKNSICSTKGCETEMENLLIDLTASAEELNSTTESFNVSEESNPKRFDIFGIGSYVSKLFSSNKGNSDGERPATVDGQPLSQAGADLNSLQDKISTDFKIMQSALDELKAKINESSEVQEISQKVQKYSIKVKSLTRTIIMEKFDVALVTVRDVARKLKEVNSTLNNTTHKFAFASSIELMKRLKVESEIFSTGVKFSMMVPIVRKERLTIFKIIKTPAKVGKFAIVLNIKNIFVAHDGESIVFGFDRLDGCIESTSKVFMCELQLNMSRSNGSDCLSQIALQRIVDIKICSDFILIAQLPQNVMIINDAGEIWFSTKYSKKIATNCDGKKETLNIKGTGLAVSKSQCNGSGIQSLHQQSSEGISKSFLTSVLYSNTTKLAIPPKMAAPKLKNDQIYSMEQFMKIASKLSACIVSHRFRFIINDMSILSKRRPPCSQMIPKNPPKAMKNNFFTF